jgi:hypothetical protein
LRGLIPGWELHIAIALIVGIGLRVLIPLQIFANLNYILAKTYGSGNANLDRLTIIILVTMFLISPGRYYGLDGFPAGGSRTSPGSDSPGPRQPAPWPFGQGPTRAMTCRG